MYDNSCAFPVPREQEAYGLTKRELFAAMSMQGQIAYSGPGSYSQETMVKEAVSNADALLAELEKPEEVP